jgi:hypothetical protein
VVAAQPRRRAEYLPGSVGDLKRLHTDDPRLATRAYALVDLIVGREIIGDELRLLPSYGDLSDCRKVYFGATGPTISHRLVYREVADGRFEIVEVVAVEQREDGYAYLLAASRLGRLPLDTRTRFNRLHQTVIKRRSEKRPPPR